MGPGRAVVAGVGGGRFAGGPGLAKSCGGEGRAELFEKLWLYGLHVKISLFNTNTEAWWMARGMDRELKKQES